MITSNRNKMIRAARLSIALLITFWITWYFQIPESTWALFTCCFVVFEFTTFGGVIAKSWLRAIATFASALYSLFFIYFFGNNIVINLIALVAGIFAYAYLFLDKKEIYLSILGCVTLTLTLINYNSVSAGVVRPFNIALGIFISMLTFKFFYPAYAKEKVIAIQRDYINHLQQVINDFLNKEYTLESVKEKYLVHENHFLNDINAFHQSIDEARMEMKKNSPYIHNNISAFDYCRRLHRLVSVLIYHLATELIRANELICADLEKIEIHLKKISDRFLPIVKSAFDQTVYNPTSIPIMKENPDKLNQSGNLLFIQILITEILEQIEQYNKELDKIIPICLNKYCED